MISEYISQSHISAYPCSLYNPCENVSTHEKNFETRRETRSITKDISVAKTFVCFVFGEKRIVDTNPYMEGGLGR